MSKCVKAVRALLVAAILGVILGFAGGVFYLGIKWATGTRQDHPVFLFLLPVGALLIAFFYRYFEGDSGDGGTNRVIAAVNTDTEVSIKMAPAIFVSTIFSHLCGASVGREGAALQLGGSVGYNVGKVFRLSDTEKKLCTVCGMSACFSAIFGTPLAAAIFALEIAVVGQMNLLWLVPALLSSYVARVTARWIGAPDLTIALSGKTPLTLIASVQSLVIAAAGGLCALLFCTLLEIGEKRIRKPYVTAVVLGAVLLVLSFVFRGQVYNGAGVDQIPLFMQGQVSPWQFAVKMMFTLLSVYAGYKGGEIVPSFYMGGALGAALGGLMGLNPGLACAIGMVSMFCGVTKCPFAAFVIGLEIFGADAAPFFMMAAAIAFVTSGKTGLYATQKRLDIQ